MIIRKARIKDIDNVVKLGERFINDHNDLVFSINPIFEELVEKKDDAKDVFKQFVRNKIYANNAAVYVAEDKGKLVAYSLIYIKKNNPTHKIEKVGYFSDLFVKKEYRGKKIASRFKELALKFFKDKGVNYASIACNPHNELAKKIYRNWGFIDYSYILWKKI